MKNIQNKVELLRVLAKKMVVLKDEHVYREMSVLRRVLSDTEWNLLDEEGKQTRRKSALDLMNNWNNEPLFDLGGAEEKKRDFGYEESVIEVYEVITSLLKRIPDNDLAVELLRLKVFLIIEKDFINDKFISNKHIPPGIFENLVDMLEEKHAHLPLRSFVNLYQRMYLKWPTRPAQTKE